MSRPRQANGRRLAGAVLSAALLAGCSTIGIDENTFESGPLPAIADADVARVLAGLDDAINEANAARDPEVLATVESDPLLAVETARYALDATADPEDADPLPPVEHTDPTVFVPRFEKYPRWFVVASTLVPGTPMRLEVISHDSAAAPWIVSMSTDLLPGVEFPTLALDDEGYVVALPVSESDGDLADLATAHAAALGGAEVTGVAQSLAADPWTVDRLAVDASRATTVGDAATVAATYASAGALPLMLRTQDGGTLGFYSLSEHIVYTVAANYFLQLDAATAALVGADKVTKDLTEDWTALIAVYVPPDGTGTARVVGARFDRTGITGS
jgi:hypothetical protein